MRPYIAITTEGALFGIYAANSEDARNAIERSARAVVAEVHAATNEEQGLFEGELELSRDTGRAVYIET